MVHGSELARLECPSIRQSELLRRHLRCARDHVDGSSCANALILFDLSLMF